jgi:hypothetical protein
LKPAGSGQAKPIIYCFGRDKEGLVKKLISLVFILASIPYLLTASEYLKEAHIAVAILVASGLGGSQDSAENSKGSQIFNSQGTKAESEMALSFLR